MQKSSLEEGFVIRYRALPLKKEVSVAVEKNECRGWWYARDGTIEEVEAWHVSLGSDPICKERDAGVQPDQTLYEPDNMEEELRFSIRCLEMAKKGGEGAR